MHNNLIADLAAMDLDKDMIAELEDEESRYDDLPDDLKESGAIPAPLKDVRQATGKDREEWKTKLQNEFDSFSETNAIEKSEYLE